MATAEEVKYLTFVQRTAESVYGYAESGYSQLKESVHFKKMPEKFRVLFNSVEERLQPVLSIIVVPYSVSALRFADSMVEAGVTFGSELTQTASSHGKEAVENLKVKVQKTLQTEYVTDVKNTAQARYTSAHGAIISSPMYAQLYTAALNYSKWALSLSVVRKPAEIVYSTAYPRVKGVVDPVVTKVEPYVKALEEHLEPRAGNNSPLAVSSASDTSSKGGL